MSSQLGRPWLRAFAAAALVTLSLVVSAVKLSAANRSLFFPHLISGMGFQTRVVFDNPTSASAQVVLTARDDNGKLILGPGIHNPVGITVAAHQHVSGLAGDLLGLPSGSLTLGWIQADSDNSQVTATLLASTTAQESGAGVEAGATLQTSLAGAIPTGLGTAVALANPNGADAAVTLRIYDSNGRQRGTTNFSIPAEGHRAQFLNDTAAGAGSFADGGHFEISSSVGLAGLEVITGLSGYTLTSINEVNSGPYVFPRVVSGPDSVTTLSLENTNDFAIQALWRAWNSSGQPLNGTDRSPVVVAIPAHGTYSGSVANLFGLSASTVFQGTVQVDVSPLFGNPLAAVTGAGLAVYQQGAAVSSLLAESPTSGIFLLTQDASGSGSLGTFQLVNPGDASAQVAIFSYGASGNQLGSTSATLTPHEPFSLSGVVPSGAVLVVMRASNPIVGYQSQPDSNGVLESLPSRILPPQIGGAVPLSAQLGGSVVAIDALARVDVPMGALDSDAAISITSLTSNTVPNPPAGQLVMAAFQVTPAGLQFHQPVTLQFPVLNTMTLPANTVLQIYSSGKYQPTTSVVKSGPGGTSLIATVTSFPPSGSTFVVLVPDTSGSSGGIVGGGGGGGGGGSGGGGGGGSGGGSVQSGGIVTSSDGQSSVIVPPGAAPANTSLQVASVSPNTLPIPPNNQSVLMAMQVGPSGMQFSTPVTLRFNVPVQLQGRLPNQLPLQIYNPLTGGYDASGFQAVLSADGTTMTASVTHFTTFVILQPFTPFASPVMKNGTLVQPIGIFSISVPPARVAAPVINAVIPNFGPIGNPVVITGTGLGNAAVDFGGVPVPFTIFDIDSTIVVTVPSGVQNGPLTITVTTPAGSAQAPFTVGLGGGQLPPTISSFSPASGQVGSSVTINGTNLLTTTAVLFNGVPSGSVNVVSGSQITATVPTSATTGPITVITTAGSTETDCGQQTGPALNGPQCPSGQAQLGTPNFTVTLIPGVPILPVDNGVLLPGAALIVRNSGSAAVLQNAGTLLPSASLTLMNPFSTAGAATPGTLIPGAALTVSNPFSTNGAATPGVLLPEAALTISNQYTVGCAPSAGLLLPGSALTVQNPGPDLTISITHPGSVFQGQTSVTYTVTVSNLGPAATFVETPVTTTITLPNGLTPRSANGTGWATFAPCNVAGQTITCSRSDALSQWYTPPAVPDGSVPPPSYPVITITADVGAAAPIGTATATATISGGGDASPGNNTATTQTVITAPGVNVNIDATVNGCSSGNCSGSHPAAGSTVTPLSNKAQLTLPAGTYIVTNGSGTPGANSNFTAWRFNGGANWIWSFIIANDSNGAVVMDSLNSTNACLSPVFTTQASAAGQSCAVNFRDTFTLAATTTLDFLIEDAGVGDNAGGMALYISPVSGQLFATGGTNQAATHGTALSLPFTVLVTNGAGSPLANVSVSFTVTGGGGGFGGLPGSTTVNTITNALGYATSPSNLTLGATAGANTVRVDACTGALACIPVQGSPITFTATGN